MQEGMLPVDIRKEVLDQCVFGRDYRKTTNIWHDIEGWTPGGITGDGRCHSRCGKGSMHKGYFKHTKALAMEPIRGPRGPGHTKEKNALPYDLLLEFAGAALHELPVSTDSGWKVIGRGLSWFWLATPPPLLPRRVKNPSPTFCIVLGLYPNRAGMGV